MQDFSICTNFRNLTWSQYIEYIKTQDFCKVFNIDENIYYNNYEIINTAFELLNESVYIKKVDFDVLEMNFGDYVEIVQCLQDTETYLDILCVLDKIEYKERNSYKQKIKNEKIDSKIDLFYSVCTQVSEIEKDLQEYNKQYYVPLKDEEKNIGLENFGKKWGYYAIIDSLSKSDITKQKEIICMQTIDVLAKIKYDIEKNYYTYKLKKEYEATFKRNSSYRK